ncbi:MAG: PHB depolymerase family esterase [Micavibrio sp.]|nr:PHB depolymerase family esterase [Micavibrio sp.]
MKTCGVVLALVLCFWSFAANAAEYKGTVGDDSRAYYVHVPDSLKGKKNLPVVMVLHGGGGSAENARKMTGMDETADRNGFIAVYPEGSGGGFLASKLHTWNAGLCCGASSRKKIDDVTYLSQVIDALIAGYGADPARIYATGHSNGAMMSYRLACELSDKIAAIAPNAGTLLIDDCHPVRPVPMIAVHGTADPCVLYNGGKQCGGCFSKAIGIHLPGDQWPCQPVPVTVAEHAEMNGCSDEKKVVMTKGAVTCTQYTCPANAAVELCSIQGAGHMWAGHGMQGTARCVSMPDDPRCNKVSSITGGQNNDIDASQVIWDFLKNYKIGN